MNYQINKIGDTIIFKINETSLDTNISSTLKGKFTILFQEKSFTTLIVDLSKVEICDSAGLSALLTAKRLAVLKDCQIVFVTLNEKVFNLIKIVKLDRELLISSTVEEAISELV